MNKCLLLLLFLSVILCGCGNASSKLEFVQVVQDHKSLTIETNDAVIATIRSELDAYREQGVLSADMESSANDLIARLEMCKYQSKVISDYVNANEIDQELLARLLRARWKEGVENVSVDKEDSL